MLQIGDNAPDFELASHLDKDRKVRLSELRGQNVVIAFYPLDWTPVERCRCRPTKPIRSASQDMMLKFGHFGDSIPSHVAWAKA
jgi:peroxiredoxin